MKILLCLMLISTISNAEFRIAIDEQFFLTKKINMVDDLTELYRRMGIEVEFDIVPGERAVKKTIEGYYQALDARFINPEVFVNLIPVQEPIYYTHNINAYSLTRLSPINNYKDLEPYIIAFPRGVQLQKKIHALVPNLQTFNSPDFEVTYKALLQNRADIIVISDVVINVIFDEEVKKTLFKLNKQPLEVINTYHHLHQSQAHLEPRLSKIIREMKGQGYFKMDFSQ
ncbi:MAG: ABC transporter substrate-binding protein [Saccharospirillaceae bacterium]|nr:transporter substrate-binding domain-containing protein [Pseudomonadales bacterium]NRB80423.1 ABC transporter substrate-binding protein [Saccharospirillaceae bacterium]